MPRSLTQYFLVLLVMNIEYSNEDPEANVVVLKESSNRMGGKIVGGVAVPKNRFPSMVQLYNLGNICAGSILNSWTVLSAAHCFDYNTDINELVVQAGTRFIYDFNADAYGVLSLVIHNKYNETRNFAHDIALIFLATPLKFTEVTKKGVLVNNDKWMNGAETNFSVAGWGWTKYGGELSKKGLMMTYLRFIPNDECGKMHDMPFSEDMFCLYGEGRTDTCKGDSGGGVLWHNMIVGITSHGDGCSKQRKPSVYTNVYYFRHWIEEETHKFIKTYCHNDIFI